MFTRFFFLSFFTALKVAAAPINLVDIAASNPRIVLDIRYATSNNFLGFPVYPRAACYLHEKAAQALNEAEAEFAAMQLGIKIFDGYRPLSVQQLMWDTIQDERYVSNPKTNKGRHTRGTAIDLTLIYSSGNELEMTSEFDDFSEKAHSDYSKGSPAAIENRELLHRVMIKHGFTPLPTEWWHFDLNGWLDDINYPPLDISFDELEGRG